MTLESSLGGVAILVLAESVLVDNTFIASSLEEGRCDPRLEN